jgi:hypothetical protein
MSMSFLIDCDSPTLLINVYGSLLCLLSPFRINAVRVFTAGLLCFALVDATVWVSRKVGQVTKENQYWMSIL